MRITLLDSDYLLPSLAKSLTEAGFAVAISSEGQLDVVAPWVSSAAEATALVSSRAHWWAGLHGVPLVIDPAPDRRAHPALDASPVRRREKSSRPTVSIGLPIFGGDRYLVDALDSLLAQTYGDFEIIVCDSGSDHGISSICHAYALRDERISYHRADEHRGAAWTYNRTLALASGNYFKWAAADDLCAPTYLERCVEVLDRTPDPVVLTYPKTILVDESGEKIQPFDDGLDLRQPRPHQRLRVLTRNLVGSLETSNAVFGLVRTDALRRTRGHGAFILADYALLAELALVGQFWAIPEPLFLRRREHAGISHSANTAPGELAGGFIRASGDERAMELPRLFTELLSAIERAPLSRSDRLSAYAAILPIWLSGARGGSLRNLAHHAVRTLGSPRDVTVAAPGSSAQRMLVRQAIRRVVRHVAPDYVPHVRIKVDPALAITVDRRAFERLLANLISNAVRYGDVPIVVTAEARDEFVLTVEDSGRGVASEFVPKLFDAFSRSEQSQRAADGMGLGLAISRLDAQSSGGTLVYEPAETGGARFRLTLHPSVIPGPHGQQEKRHFLLPLPLARRRANISLARTSATVGWSHR